MNLGDSITTDHISPAGIISAKSAASKYLQSKGVKIQDFNTYGARRGHDEVMQRGSFANIRLINKMASKVGPWAVHVPTQEQRSVFEVAQEYLKNGQDTIVLAGKFYGNGSSRDWAAKGTFLLGVRAIIAESYERIHRSNLVGMGVLPLEFIDGESADSLGLSGKERFSIDLNQGDMKVNERLVVKTDEGRSFEVKSRLDTLIEIDYYKNGGILHYVLRNMLN